MSLVDDLKNTAEHLLHQEASAPEAPRRVSDSPGGAAVAEPSVNDLSPVVPKGVEREPMLLLDTTGSMSYPAAEGSSIDRRSVVKEALGALVAKLGALDSQAAKEKAAGKEDVGGLMTITFANGTAESIGDLDVDNYRKKIDAIQWGGGTYIVPGWNKLVDEYMEEFGDVAKQDRPHILALVITDGEASDTQEFADLLKQQRGNTYCVVAILGFGAEHDAALRAYQAVAANNDHVRVVSFAAETDPNTIADALVQIAQ